MVVMKQFGSYFKFCHNCQNFCYMYVEATGLNEAKTLTDGDIAKIAAILSAIVAFLFFRVSEVKRNFQKGHRESSTQVKLFC